ncbi:transcriptional regulator [Candidatus Roizmanbacteria bacterium CG_4_10_14_0_8_um_filter_33_9]|uniref:Transcriptional regulator n=1 Tax=Candidatus Roizmanbacteria bacterium CG_4_10_14_0_8_um_filter_33_9 TaxID=1974826 RepID=A0A2M7QH41_9BACT|nr:MAG: transcriptional regulator [Candidatus Roizmanbacteria bacterium CG_4_10_14_0_8_um_filter_33_9]
MVYYFTSKIRRTIGKRIKKIRKSKKLKQVEVAVDAGLNPSYYGKIERGIVNFSIEKLYGIIRALNIKSSDVLSF